MRSGTATFPLDYGKCPVWLFQRMKRLARAIIFAIVQEFGPEEVLERLSDPVWFQSLGCVLAFDWNSSGLTTTTLGAIKAGLYDLQDDLGVYICGGKGGASLKTPQEIANIGFRQGLSFTDGLVFASKMAAKVDSALLQDGFQIYHHSFLFTKSGNWTVVQQGMNTASQMARRYHWKGEMKKNFIEKPHSGIASQIKVRPLDLTANESKENRDATLEMVQGSFRAIEKDLIILDKHLPSIKHLVLPRDEIIPCQPRDLELFDNLPSKNPVFGTTYIKKQIFTLTQGKPSTFTQILSQPGVGPKTIRALSLIGEIIYGAKPSYEDPARYSFAHGGKDMIPFPIDKAIYDKSIEVIEKAIRKSEISLQERDKALGRFQNAFLS